MKKAFLESFSYTQNDVPNSVSFLAGQHTFFCELKQTVNVGEEIERLETELKYHQGFAKSVGKKLQNERFVQNAPPAVIDRERKKLADAEAKMSHLEKTLAQLKA